MMDRLSAGLLMYRDPGSESILSKISEIIRDHRNAAADKETLLFRINAEINRLLKLATRYGFDKNLWQDYIAYLMIMNENPFSLTLERTGAQRGSAETIVRRDMDIFYKLYNYDFSELERDLGTDIFSVITDYTSIPKKEHAYNSSVGLMVRMFSDEMEKASGGDDLLSMMTGFYEKYGVGMLGMNKAFRVMDTESAGSDDAGFMLGTVGLSPITNIDDVRLDDLIGCEREKSILRANTEAFVSGRKANNCLLFGDSGTGKSTSVRALINEYYGSGLRMIELYKYQMQRLLPVIDQVKNRNYKFIIYMDDLSFEDDETDFKYLKAVIEGGLEARPDNVLIYATSNRRHLIRETWKDSSDVDLEKHTSDTIQEKMSLVNRFGITIAYMNPGKKEYERIVKGIAARYPEIKMSEDELLYEAGKWEVMHGGFSGRTAQQFIDYVLGKI